MREQLRLARAVVVAQPAQRLAVPVAHAVVGSGTRSRYLYGAEAVEGHDRRRGW